MKVCVKSAVSSKTLKVPKLQKAPKKSPLSLKYPKKAVGSQAYLKVP